MMRLLAVAAVTLVLASCRTLPPSGEKMVTIDCFPSGETFTIPASRFQRLPKWDGCSGAPPLSLRHVIDRVRIDATRGAGPADTFRIDFVAFVPVHEYVYDGHWLCIVSWSVGNYSRLLHRSTFLLDGEPVELKTQQDNRANQASEATPTPAAPQ